MERTRQVQAPIAEGFIDTFKDCTVFSKLDLFDAEMSRILSGLPRVLNNRDVILIGGIDKEDHDKNLRRYYRNSNVITSR